MSSPELNPLRWRAILQARAFKDIFTSHGEIGRSGEAVLADLREFCFAGKSTFDRDPQVMARREGRREVFLRIKDFLNLDEDAVQKMMEIDDGYGE
jgi:hypothetical protein